MRSPPSNFGAITNAHHVKISKTATPWDSTFEPVFGEADSTFPFVIEWLLGLEATTLASDNEFKERLLPQFATDESLAELTNCLVSLIVRSPAFRNMIRLTIEHYRQDPDAPAYMVPDALIATNMQHCQRMFSKHIAGRGKIVALYSDTREFIFGDGFLHNFSSSAAPPSAPRCLVPLTPTICVLYVRPMAHASFPRMMTMRLSPTEVEALNDIVQIYSRDLIFFRSQQPRILPEFSKRAFLQCDYHQHPWLDPFIDAVAGASFQSQ